MTTLISEFCNRYRAADPFSQLAQNMRLNDDLNQLAQNSEGMKLFNWMFRRSVGGDGNDSFMDVTPDELESFCARAGFSTVEQVAEFINGFSGNAQGLADCISHRMILNTAGMDEIGYAEFLEAVRAQCFTTADMLTWSKHDVLRLLDVESGLKIIKATPTPKFQYRIDDLRCTDFTDMGMGWIKSCGYGNITIADVEVIVEGSNGAVLGGHSLHLILYKDAEGKRVSVFFDPQNGIAFDTKAFPSKGPLPGAVKYTISRIAL